MPFVSAGVYSSEVDLSLYAETSTSTVFGLVGTFNKGPVNAETDITNLDRLIEVFGTPIDPTLGNAYPQAWFAAREYLRKGNRLKVVRAQAAASPAVSSVISIVGGSNDSLATASDGATSIPATRTLTSAGASFITGGVLVGDVVELADISTPADNGFYVVTNVAATVLTVDRDWPTGSLTSVTYTVWSGKREAGADGVTSVPATRTLTSAGSTFVTNGVTAGDILSISDPSTSGDNGVYVISQVVNETTLKVSRDLPAGSLTALDFTVYSRISSGADGSTAVAGTFSAASAQFALHGVVAGDVLRIKDAVDTGVNGYYVVSGSVTATSFAVAGTPTWGVSLTGLDYEILPGSIALSSLTPGTHLAGSVVRVVRNASAKQNFNLQVYDSSAVFLKEQIFDLNRANVAASDDVSVLLQSSVVTGRTEPASGPWAIATAVPPRPELSFRGGRDGYTGITDADFIGVAGASPTGLQVLANPEKTALSLVAIPGKSSEDIGNALVAFAEQRADCVAILDSPDSPTITTTQQILDWHNGLGGLGRTTAPNSSYATLAWTWQAVFDEYHNVDVWTAPSGHVAAAITNSDNLSGQWYAPAGFKRAKIIGSKGVRYSPTQGDRDAMQAGTACVNPIVNFVGSGIHLYGQKTLLRTNSALNRLNVRRMMLEVEKAIALAVRSLAFDPNDDALFGEFEQVAGPPIDFIKARRGIAEYRILNATSTSDRDNQTARFRVFIKPVVAAEKLVLEYVLTSQGTNFAELVEA